MAQPKSHQRKDIFFPVSVTGRVWPGRWAEGREPWDGAWEPKSLRREGSGSAEGDRIEIATETSWQTSIPPENSKQLKWFMTQLAHSRHSLKRSHTSVLWRWTSWYPAPLRGSVPLSVARKPSHWLPYYGGWRRDRDVTQADMCESNAWNWLEKLDAPTACRILLRRFNWRVQSLGLFWVHLPSQEPACRGWVLCMCKGHTPRL